MRNSKGAKRVRLESSSARNHRQARTTLLIVTAAFALVFAACKRAPAPQAKRYHLVGTVISVDTAHGSANIDGQEVPGFMAAMAMPYSVHNSKALAALSPGDQITADIVVTDTDSYLDNIVVTKKGANPANTTGPTHLPQPGEKVPDFALTNQDGKRIHLRSFQGDVLLVTFIYTRCPFPTFCPLVSRNFAQIYAQLRNDPAIGSKKIRLLSVSFDPKHDTPTVLKRYAETFKSTTGHNPFDRWEFAAVPAKELPKVANFFGLYYSASGDQIVHSLSTSVISPDGTIYKWYQDNTWKPTDLLRDAQQSLEQDNRRNAGPRSTTNVPTA